jgi:hypothetical protein
MDVVILNTLLTAWVVMAITLIFWWMMARKRSLVPSGLYNAAEALIELLDEFVRGIAGDKNGRRFFPLIATLLIYIMFANWLSLTPVFNAIGVFEPLEAHEAEFHEKATVFKDGGVRLILPGANDIEVEGVKCEAIADEHDAEVCREHAIETAVEGKVKEDETVGILAPYLRGINTDLMTTASFAIVAVFFIQYWGITTLGFFSYAGKFINFKSPIDFFVGILSPSPGAKAHQLLPSLWKPSRRRNLAAGDDVPDPAGFGCTRHLLRVGAVRRGSSGLRIRGPDARVRIARGFASRTRRARSRRRGRRASWARLVVSVLPVEGLVSRRS